MSSIYFSGMFDTRDQFAVGRIYVGPSLEQAKKKFESISRIRGPLNMDWVIVELDDHPKRPDNIQELAGPIFAKYRWELSSPTRMRLEYPYEELWGDDEDYPESPAWLNGSRLEAVFYPEDVEDPEERIQARQNLVASGEWDLWFEEGYSSAEEAYRASEDDDDDADDDSEWDSAVIRYHRQFATGEDFELWEASEEGKEYFATRKTAVDPLGNEWSNDFDGMLLSGAPYHKDGVRWRYNDETARLKLIEMGVLEDFFINELQVREPGTISDVGRSRSAMNLYSFEKIAFDKDGNRIEDGV